jgi:hypothetical protein
MRLACWRSVSPANAENESTTQEVKMTRTRTECQLAVVLLHISSRLYRPPGGQQIYRYNIQTSRIQHLIFRFRHRECIYFNTLLVRSPSHSLNADVNHLSENGGLKKYLPQTNHITKATKAYLNIVENFLFKSLHMIVLSAKQL